MGNMFDTDSLARQKRIFETSIYDDYNLNKCNVFVVDDETDASNAIKHIQTTSPEQIYVDCELHYAENEAEGKVGMVQIATKNGDCFIFDVVTCRPCIPLLAEVFRADLPRKVFHDCSRSVGPLQKLEIDVEAIEDLQVAHKIIQMSKVGIYDTKHRGLSLKDLYENVVYRSFPKVRDNLNTGSFQKWVSNRPIEEDVIKYAALNVLVLPRVFDRLEKLKPIRLRSHYRYRVLERQLGKVPSVNAS